MSLRLRRSFVSIGLAAVLSACSSGNAITPQTASTLAATAIGRHRTVKLAVRIRIPKKSIRHRAKVDRNGKPAYVSAATQGMTLAIAGPTNLSQTIGLTATSPGCASAEDGTVCSLTLSGFLPCSGTTSCYTATIATFDAVSCAPACTIPAGANELSAAQNVSFGVAIGQANALNVTLGGYPAGFTVAPLTFGFLQGDLHGLKLWGPSAVKLVVIAQDADGNAIVGPGAPSITATSGGATLSVTNPSASAPNVLALQAQTTGTPATVTPGVVPLHLTATPAADSGAMPFSLVVSVAVAHSVLYVGGDGIIEEFFDGNTSSPNATITNGGFITDPLVGLAVDRNGTLYTSVLPANLVYAFAASASGTVAPIDQIDGGSTDLSSPAGVALDSSGDVYVANTFGETITEYPAGASGDFTPPVVIFGGASGLQNPYGLAFDATGTLYASNDTGDSITEYSAGSNGDVPPVQTIFGTATGLKTPSGLATDVAGRLYVVDYGDDTVTEYAPGASGNVAPIASIGGSNTGIVSPNGVAVDAKGDVYVSIAVSPASNGVLEFAPGAHGNVAPIASIALGSNGADGVAVVPPSFSY